MKTVWSYKKSPLKFILLVYVLAIPFWLIGAVAEHFSKSFPMNLPVSALMFVCPVTAALILVHTEDKLGGIRGLFKRVFDYKKIKGKVWYVPSILMMPIILLLSYEVMSLMGRPLPVPQIPFLTIPILFVVFFIAAVCEEAGWMGYAVNPMLDRWSALKSSLILGSVGALLHVVPFIQAHRTLTWIAWQCLLIIAMRVLIVWLYNNTRKSILPGIFMHTMYNVSYSIFPNDGSHYDPAIVGAITLMIAVIVMFLWGSKTLARYKYA